MGTLRRVAAFLVLASCGGSVPADHVAPIGVEVAAGTPSADGEWVSHPDGLGSEPSVGASCGPGFWSPVPLAPVGGHVERGLNAPTTGWVFHTLYGPKWRAHAGGLILLLGWSPNRIPAGRSVVIRRVRIRARTNVVGDFVEVTVKRHDPGGVTLNMDGAAPLQLDAATTEVELIPDQDYALGVDPETLGPSTQGILLLVKTNGADTTSYEFEGADVFWELCGE